MRGMARSTKPWLLRLLLLLLGSTVRPAAALSVAFQNCLPQNYLENNDPVLLQWVPLQVEASYQQTAAQNGTYRLLVTVYGNVTGSLTTATLPAWNSSEWANASFTDGKILRDPDSGSAHPLLTTLHSKVDVLTYEPDSQDTDFCATSLTNASCPLGPVFNTSVLPLSALPSVNLSSTFNSTYAFTSFATTFIVRYGNAAQTTIGCVSAVVTPSLGPLAWLVRFLPLLVLVAVGFATVLASVYSPWGTTDFFHWTSNYGRDPDLLRLVTPGFTDCLQYLQFATLTGGLTLAYPGFYQPVASQTAWSALMFNESFVSEHRYRNGTSPSRRPALVDGLYHADGSYGLHRLGQLVGMAYERDVWAGMMVWLLVLVAAVLALFQLAFALQRLYRALRRSSREDLRSKNGPFSAGSVVRVVFGFVFLPLVSLSAFQLVAAARSPGYLVALAVVVLVVLMAFVVWLLHVTVSTKPRAVLFDDLPTLLLYGPLYNTYAEDASPYAAVPLLLNLLRGIAIGAVQPAGIAQIVLLAICEVVQVLTLHAFRPFPRQTNMNLYHACFAVFRFVTIMLMIAFIPALGITEGPKGWIGYAILLIHACVLIFGFFLNAVQTMLEVLIRMAGFGGDDVTGQTRGGLSKIFGMRQLSRRMPRRSAGAVSRQSGLSSAGMLESDTSGGGGHVMQGGRLRGGSEASLGGILLMSGGGGSGGKPGQRSSSALDNFSMDGATAYVGGGGGGGGGGVIPTPTDASSYSYLPSPNSSSRPPLGLINTSVGGAGLLAMENNSPSADPYYRPPRRARRPTADNLSPAERTRGSWASNDWTRVDGGGGGDGGSGPGGDAMSPVSPASPIGPSTALAASRDVPDDAADLDSSGQPAISFSPRTDYSTREVDFYYGVRGERLNSEAPGRKLGTGPADPTGPMYSAAGWLRTFLGGKRKEKGKGFEVVRSARMPPAMVARGGNFDDDDDDDGRPPRGIPMATGVARNGPIESDDDDAGETLRSEARSRHPRQANLLDDDGNTQDESGAGDGGVGDGHEGESGRSDGTDEPELVRVSDTVPTLPSIDAGESIHLPSRLPSRAPSQAPSRMPSSASRLATETPVVGGGMTLMPSIPAMTAMPLGPRRSVHEPAAAPPQNAGPASHSPFMLGPVPADAARLPLPFERVPSQQGRQSPGNSSNAATSDTRSHSDIPDNLSSTSPAAANMGFVQQGNVNRVDPAQPQDLLGAEAELVSER